MISGPQNSQLPNSTSSPGVPFWAESAGEREQKQDRNRDLNNTHWPYFLRAVWAGRAPRGSPLRARLETIKQRNREIDRQS